MDLGRAHEKAGNLGAALQSYSEAAELAPEDPAPFVHLGILESRRQHTQPAEAAFQKAESLYSAETNLEGIAEVDYQREYAATLRGDSEHAKEYFEKSFQIAGEIPSVQLQVRDLTHIATVEYLAENDAKAVELARQAIELARQMAWSIGQLTAWFVWEMRTRTATILRKRRLRCRMRCGWHKRVKGQGWKQRHD